jgi:stearoyl-CoA desaturase (delta-9 desaturase)
MLTHRSFEARPIVRFVLLALGCMAGMTGPLRWAAIHVQHHARADRDGDPHSPLDGFFHAHMGWFIRGFDADPDTYVPHLVNDPMIRFFQRTTWYWTALGFAVPFALGGWSGLLWGGWVRFFLIIHITFSINSICHMFGRVAFQTNDLSRNQWVLGVFGFGEGWHNNHHAFPRSAFHGLRWWQIDLAGYVIAGLERLGLVTNVRRVTREMIQARQARTRLTVR